MKATRDWFGEELVALGGRAAHTVVVNCDLGSATKTLDFREKFPDRFFECGIAEANAIGIASGLAHEGYRPFVASFGHFLTGKFLEIFQSVGLNDSGVVLVGTHAGLAIGKDGPTQMGLRDLSVMRTLPNVEILQPADGVETREMLDHLAGSDRPAYLRLCRQPQEEVHAVDYKFRPGCPDVVRAGIHVAILTMGGLVDVAVAAALDLESAGVSAAVVNVSSLPVDRDRLHEVCDGFETVFVVEDHYVVGGLGDEVRAALGLGGPDLTTWGVDGYGQAAGPDQLYARYRLDRTSLVEHVRTLVNAKEL